MASSVNYDYRECPGCKRTVCMYGAEKCQLCRGTRNNNTYPRKPAKDTRSEQEIWDDFRENGFQ